jgi:arsenate reductase
MVENTHAPARRDLRVRRMVREISRRDPHRLQVLFVCVGNSCRSQMAEAFAKAYGGTLLRAESAGLEPAAIISRRTHRVMAERGIALDSHYPKPMYTVYPSRFDLIVNLSRRRLPPCAAPVLRFPVTDPNGKAEEIHREVRDSIEHLVEAMLMELGAIVPVAPKSRHQRQFLVAKMTHSITPAGFL